MITDEQLAAWIAVAEVTERVHLAYNPAPTGKEEG